MTILKDTEIMVNNIYEELISDVYDLVNISRSQAEIIVDWLRDEGILNYDALWEYYEDAK